MVDFHIIFDGSVLIIPFILIVGSIALYIMAKAFEVIYNALVNRSIDRTLTKTIENQIEEKKEAKKKTIKKEVGEVKRQPD